MERQQVPALLHMHSFELVGSYAELRRDGEADPRMSEAVRGSYMSGRSDPDQVKMLRSACNRRA